MVSQEQSTQTDKPFIVPRQFYGIFTVVITLEQQKAAKQQRDEDRYAAKLQREQDRNMNDERYKSELFDTFIKEMGQLLKEYNGSLTANEVASTLARAKTLTIFRQLDAQRNIQIIRFLYEAKQLTEMHDNSSLDLSTAELRDMDFRNSAINKKKLNNLSLTGIFLSNATFIGIEMEHINFNNTEFEA
ncbi:unnamed protein product, partial [Rotaria sp. Silwood1]